jgi:hypothetical protein
LLYGLITLTFIVFLFVASPAFAAPTDPFQYLPNESEWDIGILIGKLIGAQTEMGLETRRFGLEKDKGNQGCSSKKDPTLAGDAVPIKVHIFSQPHRWQPWPADGPNST